MHIHTDMYGLSGWDDRFVCLHKRDVTMYVQKIQLQMQITHELYYRHIKQYFFQQNCTECSLFLIQLWKK